jgi:hypothetical protein
MQAGAVSQRSVEERRLSGTRGSYSLNPPPSDARILLHQCDNDVKATSITARTPTVNHSCSS